MMTRMLRLLLLVIAVGLIAAPASQADRTAQLMFEDPALAPGESVEAPSVIPQWPRLGAQWARVQAYWDLVSPQPNSRTMPAGFNPADPNSPGYNWTALDTAINRVRGAGLRIMLTINLYNPVWASTQPSRGRLGWKPSPLRYSQFATALARRYGSRISAAAVGNEANENFLLTPQTECNRYVIRGRTRTLCERTSAYMYRNLLRAAYPAIKRVRPGLRVIVGEIAPIGGIGPHAGNLAPLAFIRALACLDDRYRPITVGGCRGFRPPPSDGIFGYHAYQVRARPQQHTPNPNSAKLGDLARLFRALDRVTRMHRIRTPGGRRFDLWLDEYGYETCPPDCHNGVSLTNQSRYLQESAYVVWATPRVKLISQYKWRDDGSFQGQLQGFQTGLNFNQEVRGGVAKPSLFSFPHPIFVDIRRGRSRARIWGQVRRRAGRVNVQVFRNNALLLSTTTDGLGYFSAVRSLSRGQQIFFRYTFGGQAFQSDTFRVP